MSILTKIKTSSIFFLALIFTALNSCVMYYNTNEIRNNFKKNINQINNIADKAKNDFKNKSNIYKDLSGFILDRNLEPFKSISQEMKHFDIAFKAVNDKKKEVLELKKRFEKITNGKTKIKSNQPEWDEIKNIKKQMSKKGEEITAATKKYTNYSNQIGNMIKNSGLKTMDKIDFINQIEKNQESLKSSIQEIFKNVDLYRLKVNNAYNNNFINDSIYNYKLVVLNDMNILIEKVEKANELLLFYKRKFIDKTKNKHKIWIGENTYANQALNEIKKQIEMIKSAKNEFNTLSVKLNQ
tara:strand:+ start:112 stop:1002 length:891 start_codon:yes stop_codon:yes gene_type:complete